MTNGLTEKKDLNVTKAKILPNVHNYELRLAKYKSQGHWGTDTFDRILDEVVDRNLNKIAIIDNRGSITYRDLKNYADTVAANLRVHGIGRGDVVSVQLPNWKEAFIIFYATSRLGAVYQPLNTNYRAHDAITIMNLAGSKALILPFSFLSFDFAKMALDIRSEVGTLEHIWVVGEGDRHGLSSWEELLKLASQPIEPCGDAEDVFYLPYTSGTTGTPKGIMQSHCTYIFSMNQNPFKLTNKDVGLVALPIGLNFGITTANLTLYYGGTLVLMDRYNDQEMIKNIIRYNVTYFPAVPPFVYDLVNYMEEHKELRIESLRALQAAGAATPPAVIKKAVEMFGCTVYSCYGMTEDNLHTTVDVDTPIELVSTTVGRPAAPMELHILDDQMRPCPKGVAGEIAARGPGLFLGYYRAPELTAACHTPDGWFLTGDLGVVDEDGYLHIVGRKKEMIIRGGLNIDPKEVENLLLQHPKVEQVVVIGLPDDRLGERVCACIIPKSTDLAPTLEELGPFLREHGLASQKLPERVEIMKNFPLNALMKVQKFELIKQLSANS